MLEEKILKLGFMSIQEMAEWFGLKNYNSLYNNSGKKKIEELQDYCKYERVHGGFQIYEIYPYKEIYVKKKSKNYEIIKNDFLPAWRASNAQGRIINQNINVANIILQRNKDTLTIKPRTLYNYVSNIKVEDWGRCKARPGKLGYCRYVIVKCYGNPHSGNAQYVAFTSEEQKIKMEIHNKIFGKMSTEEEEQIISAQNQYKKGEITKEERNEVMSQIFEFYSHMKVTQYFTELSAAFDCNVISAIELVENESTAW